VIHVEVFTSSESLVASDREGLDLIPDATPRRTPHPRSDPKSRIDVTRWIELRYNRRRLHSALGYRTPDEVEEAWNQQNQAA
jgi:transposase InsO family protein